MPNAYTGLFLISWVARAAAKSKAYSVRADGTIVFRMHISVGIYGLIGTIATAACAFMPDTAIMLLMMAIIGPLFIPFFLYFLFARLYINDDKIIYRNPLGLRWEIAWTELSAAVKIGITGDIVLCGGRKKIRLYPYYCGFPYVLELLHRLKPEAFDPEYILANSSGEFKAKSGGLVFRGRKQFRMVAIIILLLGFVFLLFPDRMFVPEHGSQFLAKLLIAAFFIACGLSFLLMASIRLNLDDDKLVYRNMLFIKRTIRWENVQSYRIFNKGISSYIRIQSVDKKKITFGGELFGYDIIKHFIRKTSMERRIKFW